MQFNEFWGKLNKISFDFCLQSDTICDISPEVKDELRKFRFRKDNANCALICKYFDFSNL